MFSWVQKLLGYTEPCPDHTAEDETKLLASAASGDSHTLVELINAGVSINCQDLQGSTPLHFAVKDNRMNCVEFILQHPLLELRKDRWGRTPIHTAVVWQKPEMLQLLLEHTQNVINISDNDGRTPLHLACAAANVEMVKTLIRHKPNLNALDQRKWSPLMGAIAIGDRNISKLLLNHGANIDEPLISNSGMSGLKLAIEKHNYELTDLLIQHGAMVEFYSTITQGNLGQNTRRQVTISYNLATTAVENITLAHPSSIDIAMLVVQAAPSPPEEDAVIKMYEQLVKPSRRFQRSLSRDLLQLLENISEATIHKIMRLIMISLAVGVDLSNSNIDRLSRKFRLDPRQDVKFFALIRALRDKSLTLLTIQSFRKQLCTTGNLNIVSALKGADFPMFVKDLLLLRGNI